ncbi:DUF1318 domain-containing protein [Hippea maritima]|uniref:DUF1318 domain-containing protein n=1 Tax=Hippea maritima (strain ATCC 700847 / DSM 10411 / MH2) TaxID=760142 RepID=F2LX36_HIPMA|nr:DUF1318 domain-containing protein [Hippea maritima]AEA33094.1 hypothetical protein Hipma_0114 [Hippea maritima DSM 10411]
MKKLSVLWSVILLLVYSCVTVNIYFPARQAQEKAKEIVNDIRGEKKTTPKTEPTSLLELLIPTAHASDVLNTTNAKIKAIKESMKKRFELMKPYYKKGYLGETLDGHLKIYRQPPSLKDKVKLKKLVVSENKDRESLYHEVARVLNIQPSQIDRLRRIFAKQWQDTAPNGTYIETKTGWIRKKD